MNDNNLVSLGTRSPDERRRIAKMGGKARQKQMQRRKAIREVIQELQTLPMGNADCENLGLPKGTPYQTGLAMSIVRQALDGNAQMARVLLTCLGEMKQDINVSTNAPPIVLRKGMTAPEDYPGVVIMDNIPEDD